jgi:hypothetical protein
MFFLLFFAGFVLFIFLLVKFILAYTARITEIAVGSKHQDAEQITFDGMVPQRWSSGRLAKVLVSSPARRKRMAMKRMQTLLRYFAHTPLVADDESREMLIKRLEYIRDDWRAKTPAELFPE